MVCGLVLGSALLWLPPLPASAGQEVRAGDAETCRHYANRARFLRRGGPVDFIVLLAEGCAAAERSLAAPDPRERAAARHLLDRLAALRATVIEMNMHLVYGEPGLRRTRSLSGSGWMGPIRSVSRSGEYLIAHRMGLIAAFETWRRQAPGFALALR